MAALVTPAASLVSELMVQGRQSAAVLEALLQDASPTEHAGIRELAAEILRCCDRALAALHHGGVADGGDSGRKRKSGAAAQTRRDKRARASGGEAAAAAKRVEKKRTAEDGFIWRKYGQKEILNSKHPRLYFRCTYKDDSGCPATRQVQMSEDDPSLFVITYFGHHTCCADVAAAAGAASDEVSDIGETRPFVINFGSSSSDDYCVGQSEASSRSSSRNGCKLEGGNGEEELRPMAAKVEAASPDLQPAAEPCSSGDASCASLPWDWDIFNDTSFDDVSDFFPF